MIGEVHLSNFVESFCTLYQQPGQKQEDRVSSQPDTLARQMFAGDSDLGLHPASLGHVCLTSGES